MDVLRRWLGLDAQAAEGPLPTVGQDARVYAIGDIHGRADLLDNLLGMIAQDDAARGGGARRHLVLLGDLVDRGPTSAQVVRRAQALAGSGAGSGSVLGGNLRLIKGNHEEVFVRAARGDARAVPLFRRIGGVETLASYGLEPDACRAMDDAALAGWMLTHVPRDHVDFLDGFADSSRIGDYLFVHAGIRPRVPIADQSGADLRWIRHEFLEYEGHHGVMIVHGHSIMRDVDERSNRIGIDTGAYYSGRLTALGLQGTDRWFLQTGG